MGEPDDDIVRAIGQKHAVPELVARVLALRGVKVDDAQSFLEPRIRDCLPDPSHLLDLDAAVERLAAAVLGGEKIGIIGDYDVDGATSTALVYRCLSTLGAEIEVVIPDRLADGYGPNPRAIDALVDAGCKLLLTLDSGTTAFTALEHARQRGLDTIVVDHHSTTGELPPAIAVVNPNRQDQESALGDLAAVGVAFVLLVGLARALRGRREVPDLMGLLDLVALGTVCDVVPLRGLNRAFVRQGLKVAMSRCNPGMRQLARTAGLDAVRDARSFGFALGPRINAGGRLGRSDLGWRLLTTEDHSEAEALAVTLDEMNKQRKSIEREVLRAATKAVSGQLERDVRVLVAAGEGWHPGVVGIVASRLADAYARPAFVIGLDEGIGKGSARSMPGIDIGRIVLEARQKGIVREGGGHPMAAGVTLEESRLEAFREFVEASVAASPAADRGSPPIELDALLAPGGVSLDLVEKLRSLAPFGAGNPEPLLCLKNARVMRPREVGQGHLSCLLGGPAGGAVKAIAFRAVAKGLDAVLAGDGGPLWLAGRARRDDFGGTPKPSFEIDDAAPAP